MKAGSPPFLRSSVVNPLPPLPPLPPRSPSCRQSGAKQMSIAKHRFVRALQACSLIAVLVGSGWIVNQRAAAATEEVPQFKFDATYPRPLPNGWILGAIGALWVDSKDHVWVAQRPGS